MGAGAGKVQKKEAILIFRGFVIIIKRVSLFGNFAGEYRITGRECSHGDSQQEISSTYET